jgi:hypothetical protein
MGYLVCEKCGGHYELEDNESPEDFDDTCECGGKLNYIESLEEMKGVKLSSDSSISSERFFKKCPYCGFNNKYQAKFCKQCGKKLEKNLITRINDEINVLAVFIGLGVSCIVLIIGSLLFGSIVASASLDLSIYVGLVLIVMVFCGGTATGLVGCHDFKDGIMNGLILSLISLVILGFVVGVMLFITLGIAAAISSAFASYSSTAASSSSSIGTTSASSDSGSLDFIFTIIKGVIILVMVFISGAVGGSFGVFLKNGFKNMTTR